MKDLSTTNTIEQAFWPVKSPDSNIGSYSPDSMIHHKVSFSRKGNMIVSYSKYRCKAYGVSSPRRALTPELLMKKHDYICGCLNRVLGLTIAQREVTLRLLRYWAYYGYVYPKESTITEDPGCSKATFWRTVKLLKELGLISVVNRYVIRPHAQISNLYRLDNLVKLIAKYLAEHTADVWPDWILPIIKTTWPALFDACRALEHRTQHGNLSI